jgi:hypothetical protein
VIPTPPTPPGHAITVHTTPPRTHGRAARLVLVCECGTWYTVLPAHADLEELDMRRDAHHTVARAALMAAPA